MLESSTWNIVYLNGCWRDTCFWIKHIRSRDVHRKGRSLRLTQTFDPRLRSSTFIHNRNLTAKLRGQQPPGNACDRWITSGGCGRSGGRRETRQEARCRLRKNYAWAHMLIHQSTSIVFLSITKSIRKSLLATRVRRRLSWSKAGKKPFANSVLSSTERYCSATQLIHPV